MMLYLVRRLLLLAIILLILSAVGFALNSFTPGAPVTEEPLPDAFVHWLTQLAHLDFGVSHIDGQPVSRQLAEVLPATLELCFLAFLLSMIVGIPLGTLSGVLYGKWQDKTISALALTGFSVPVFWLALSLPLFLSLSLEWFPLSGRLDLLYPLKNVTGFLLIDIWLSDSAQRGDMLINALSHLAMPVIVLSVAPCTEIIRLLRISTIDVIQQNYIKAASTRGLSRFTIIHRHVLHNALPPVIPRLGWQFATMLALTMITEKIFSWPGLGYWLLNATQQQDYAAMSAGVMVTGGMVLVVNILADLAGAILMPQKDKEHYAF